MNNQQELEKPQQNKMLKGNFLANYIDMTIRGVLVFIIIALIYYFILNKLLHLDYIFALPIAFVISMLISPTMAKIKLGTTIQAYYDDFLFKVAEKFRKSQ